MALARTVSYTLSIEAYVDPFRRTPVLNPKPVTVPVEGFHVASGRVTSVTAYDPETEHAELNAENF